MSNEIIMDYSIEGVADKAMERAKECFLVMGKVPLQAECFHEDFHAYFTFINPDDKWIRRLVKTTNPAIVAIAVELAIWSPDYADAETGKVILVEAVSSEKRITKLARIVQDGEKIKFEDEDDVPEGGEMFFTCLNDLFKKPEAGQEGPKPLFPDDKTTGHA